MKPLTEYILESFNLVYHYMGTGDLISLMKSGTFYVEDDDGYNASQFEGMHYMSTTRQRNALTGYPTGIINRNIVRITLDYDKLHSKYKSSPVDWGRAKGKAIKANWEPENFEQYKHDIMLQTNVEMEERFYIKQDSIPDFFRYVKQVDICSKFCPSNTLTEILTQMDSKYPDVVVKVYKSEKDFKIGR